MGPPGAQGQPGPSGAMPMMPPTQQPQPPPQPVQPTPELPVFVCPRRPNQGVEGRPIMLRANHFQINMPRGVIHHYDITIQPDKCPRKVNRLVFMIVTDMRFS